MQNEAGTLSIRYESGLFPDRISVDGQDFLLVERMDGHSSFRRSSHDGTMNGTAPLFVSVAVSDEYPEDFLPYTVCINRGKKYRRRFDGFYTPDVMKPDEVEKFFDLIACSYESVITKELNLRVYELLFKRLSRYLRGCARPLRILDFGIGTGYSYDIACRIFGRKGVEFFGVDLSQEMVNICRNRGVKNVWKCSYEHMPFLSGSFDGVVACYVVHYLHDVATPLREISRVLRPGGAVVFNLHKPLQGHQDYYGHLIRKRGLYFDNVGFTTRLIDTHDGSHQVHLARAKKAVCQDPMATTLELALQA